MATPPQPPPVRLRTDGGPPKLAVRKPRITFAAFVAEGIITPANVHANWLELFPAGPRAVTRREAKGFVQRLDARLLLSREAVSEIFDLCCPHRGTPSRVHGTQLFDQHAMTQLALELPTLSAQCGSIVSS